MTETIIITGASGFIGKQLVPVLSDSNCKLLLVGRCKNKLRSLFPTSDVCTYEELPERGAEYNKLIHLAVANTDSTLPDEDIHRTNVDFLIDTVTIAKSLKVKKFVNVSSIHALDPHNISAYASSKREVFSKLGYISGIEIRTVFLPLVFGTAWAGKIKFLNKLPKFIGVRLFSILASLKPTIHINKLAQELLWDASPTRNGYTLLAESQQKNPVYTFFKRSIDLTTSAVVILLFGWAMIAIWVVVKLDSPGPGILSQRRVGRYGKEFICYKFRTMKNHTAQVGTHELTNSSVTRVGKYLRQSKLDELPQIWNIIKNEISLIGPRPCLPMQVKLIDERHKLGVYSLKPGMTGLAQINGVDMSVPEKLAVWDWQYKKQQSILLDIRILIITAKGAGSGDRISQDDETLAPSDHAVFNLAMTLENTLPIEMGALAPLPGKEQKDHLDSIS